MSDDDILAVVTGVVTNQPTLRKTRTGKPWLAFAVLVQAGFHRQWVNVACFGDDASDIATRTAKGGRVKVEGRLSLKQWIDTDGRERAGLSVIATTVAALPPAPSRPRSPRRPNAALQDYAKPRGTDQRLAASHAPASILTPEQQAIPSFE